MLSTNLKDSFIINCFRDFYREVILCKAMALSGRTFDTATTISVDNSTPEPAGENPEDALALKDSKTLARKIFLSLELLLGNQLNKVTQTGGEFSLNYYREALYIMVSLADEVFLNLKWAGRSEWESNLLESRFFGTHTAGTTFFEKLDTYLATRDPSSRDIGALYLWALGLGFQGKYRGENLEITIGPYKRKLYYFIMWRSSELFKGKNHLFSKVYDSTIDNSVIKNLPNPRFYFMLFLGLLMTLFIASGIIWYSAVSKLYTTVDAIVNQEKGEGI